MRILICRWPELNEGWVGGKAAGFPPCRRVLRTEGSQSAGHSEWPSSEIPAIGSSHQKTAFESGFLMVALFNILSLSLCRSLVSSGHPDCSWLSGWGIPCASCNCD
jgi:hypothetical protein